MKRVVIMCHGQQSRLPGLKTPKQLLPLIYCGETILDRTIRLVEAYDDVGEIVVVGPPTFATHFAPYAAQRAMPPFEYALLMSRMALDEWSCDASIPDARKNARVATFQRARSYPRKDCILEVVSLDNPGNSVIRGLQALSAYLKKTRIVTDGEYYHQTTILLGDVVYSRQCLHALLEGVPPVTDGTRELYTAEDVWFAASADLSRSAGEMFGMSYVNRATTDVVATLARVKHPPFADYQPGQLRSFLWDWQIEHYGTEAALAALAPSVREVVKNQLLTRPFDRCCYVVEPGHDYTWDIDTPQDLLRLAELDFRAYKDDHGVSPLGATAARDTIMLLHQDGAFEADFKKD